MRKVFAIGETVLDILFNEYEPFTAKAGGSCLNSAVTLGRLGINCQFISEYGLDEVGNFIDKFLNENSVSTRYVYRYYDGKSPLALAFLNKNHDASYDFYKIYPEKRLVIEMPEIQQDDIVLFGSFYSITKEVRAKFIQFIKMANKNKAILIYDPNFRKQYLHELKQLKSMLHENIKYAHIIRGSNEDFSCIYGSMDADETYQEINDKGKSLIYTANKYDVNLRGCGLKKKYSVPQIDAKSTIGAGDSFNAGIIYSLLAQNIRYKDLHHIKENEWTNIIETGISFASHVCLTYENYVSKEFAQKFLKENS